MSSPLRTVSTGGATDDAAVAGRSSTSVDFTRAGTTTRAVEALTEPADPVSARPADSAAVSRYLRIRTLLGVISSRKRRYLVLRVDDTHRTIHGSAARRVQLAHRANLRTARRPRSRRFLRRRWNVEREPERGAPDEVDMENADSEIREVE